MAGSFSYFDSVHASTALPKRPRRPLCLVTADALRRPASVLAQASTIRNLFSDNAQGNELASRFIPYGRQRAPRSDGTQPAPLRMDLAASYLIWSASTADRPVVGVLSLSEGGPNAPPGAGVLADERGVLLGAPRCGAVQSALEAPVVRRHNPDRFDVLAEPMECALKNLHLGLMQAEHDDGGAEVAAMARLQPRGLRGADGAPAPLLRGYMNRWDWRASAANFYLLTERADFTLGAYLSDASATLLRLNAAAGTTGAFRRGWFEHILGNVGPQLLAAVADIHAHLVAHLDLCPDNVMVKIIDGVVVIKLIDFGSAALLDVEAAAGAAPGFIRLALRHKNKMDVPGCIRRGAAAHDPVDAKSMDVFMAGVITYIAAMMCFREAFPPEYTVSPTWALTLDLKWHENLLRHAATGGDCAGAACILCHLRDSHPELALGEGGEPLPAATLAILARMLSSDPAQRDAPAVLHMLNAQMATW